MQKTLFYSSVIVAASVIIGYGSYQLNKIFKDKNIGKSARQDPHYQEKFIAQIQSYYSFAKTAKTEYQLDSFLDKLSLVRESHIQEFHGEENWKNFLEWLKTNGATILSTNEDGVPDLSQREISRFEISRKNWLKLKKLETQ